MTEMILISDDCALLKTSQNDFIPQILSQRESFNGATAFIFIEAQNHFHMWKTLKMLKQFGRKKSVCVSNVKFSIY